MMPKAKFDDWTVSLKKTRGKLVVVACSGESAKKIPLVIFFEKGMQLFPKPLYDKIKRDVRYANIYDSFLDKLDFFYEESSNENKTD